MENTRFWVQKKGHGEKDSLSEESSASQFKKLVKRANSHKAIIANIIQSQNSNVFLKDLFFLLVHGHYRIPKHMASANEIYVRHCLEFVHISAFKAPQYNTPVTLQAKNMLISAESLNTAKFIGGDECGSGQLVFGHPVASMTESVIISTNDAEKWTSGAVMGSRSMVNILESPLLQQFGDNLSRMNFTDAKNMICYDYMDSPSGFSISSSYKLKTETPMVQSPMNGSISAHKGITSTSRTNSTCFDCLSSASSTLSKGMLKCTWKQGIPHFVFSADDQKEVYVAKLIKVDTTDDEALDYVYLFHLDKGGQKGRETSDSDLLIVGKMNVSTSFTLCPDNYRIMETQFILFGNNKVYDKEIYTSNHSHWKRRGLSKKVSQVFITSPSSKQRTLSKFSGTSATIESCPLEHQSYGIGGVNLLETNVPPNFELAAIVAKDHLPFHSLDKVGGWGLKFLKKPGVNQTRLPSESYGRNTGDCSTSMSILIPAGLHGGPRTRHDGPSSLIDRWRFGGCCNCGGWDEGCPLTVLQRRSSNVDVPSQVDMQGECKSVDLVPQGSSNFSPTLRMVNIRDGLYFIHFLSPLSALQSFSIAVAVIHTQSPTLRPNSSQELC